MAQEVPDVIARLYGPPQEPRPAFGSIGRGSEPQQNACRSMCHNPPSIQKVQGEAAFCGFLYTGLYKGILRCQANLVCSRKRAGFSAGSCKHLHRHPRHQHEPCRRRNLLLVLDMFPQVTKGSPSGDTLSLSCEASVGSSGSNR